MGEEEEHQAAIRVPIDALERHLLLLSRSGDIEPEGDEPVLYSASFEEEDDEANEEMKFVRYQTAQWVLYSLVLILAWGIGLLMLLYLPLRIYNCKREFRSKKLYLTPMPSFTKFLNPSSYPALAISTNKNTSFYLLFPMSLLNKVISNHTLESLPSELNTRVLGDLLLMMLTYKGFHFPLIFRRQF